MHAADWLLPLAPPPPLACSEPPVTNRTAYFGGCLDYVWLGLTASRCTTGTTGTAEEEGGALQAREGREGLPLHCRWRRWAPFCRSVHTQSHVPHVHADHMWSGRTHAPPPLIHTQRHITYAYSRYMYQAHMRHGDESLPCPGGCRISHHLSVWQPATQPPPRLCVGARLSPLSPASHVVPACRPACHPPPPPLPDQVPTLAAVDFLSPPYPAPPPGWRDPLKDVDCPPIPDAHYPSDHLAVGGRVVLLGG